MVSSPLSHQERTELLQCAREAIASAVGVRLGASRSRPAAGPSIGRRAGAFVTLRIDDGLRGCVGYPAADLLLVEVVERCAASAALSDPRFPAVQAHEFPALVLEISVLGSIEPIGAISEVELGRHGLVARLGANQGLLLPQVATEWHWDRETFVRQTCLKAGLPPDAWNRGARLFKFEAEVFGEVRPTGPSTSLDSSHPTGRP